MMDVNLENLSREGIDNILAECLIDSAFMAKLVFPESFSSEFSELHHKYFDFIDNCEAPKKGIIAPRGFIKTTGNKLIIKKNILYRRKRFIGYLTNSGDIAVSISDSIKSDLMSNQFVRKIFGNIKESSVEGIDEKWSEKSWIANGYTMVLPRGQSQQVNGLNWMDHRPDLWIIDDLEDRTEVRSEEQRKKLRDWFFGVLLYTFSQYDADKGNQEIVYTDTIKHPDALMCHLMDDPDWEILNLPVCDKSYHTLAPKFKSQETLDKEIESHRRNGTMDIFAMEQMGSAQSEEMKNFKSDWIKYYNENDDEFVNGPAKRLVNILIWDPARTKNPRSADTGFVIWGLDFSHNAFYVRLVKGEKLSASEQYEEAIKLATWYQVQALGIELDGLHDHILYPFINECNRKKLFWLPPRIVELKARSGKGELKGEEGGKEGRIAALFPYYEKGLVWHDRTGAARLEQQLLGSRLRDIADAAAYLPQMLLKPGLYMSPQQEEKEEDRYNEQQAFAQLEAMDKINRSVFV